MSIHSGSRTLLAPLMASAYTDNVVDVLPCPDFRHHGDGDAPLEHETAVCRRSWNRKLLIRARFVMARYDVEMPSEKSEIVGGVRENATPVPIGFPHRKRFILAGS